jgi:hypothetical protein
VSWQIYRRIITAKEAKELYRRFTNKLELAENYGQVVILENYGGEINVE